MEEDLKIILEFYGEENQAKQLVQELAELVVGITKNDIENIKEEIADIEVMMSQFCMFRAIKKDILKNLRKLSERNILIDPMSSEDRLIVLVLKLAQNIVLQEVETSILLITEIEVILKNYKKYKKIDFDEIKIIKESKIKRQLKRIEDTKRNRFIANKK